MFCATYTLTSAMTLFESYNIIPLLLREDSHYSYASKRSFVTDLGHFKCLSGVLISPLRTVSEFWASVPLESNRHWQPNSVQTHRASTVTAVMLDGALSLSLAFFPTFVLFSLSCRVHPCLVFSNTLAKTYINHGSMQPNFPPRLPGKKVWERPRPHPVSVYLCYYRGVKCEASPFISVFAEISILSGERLEMGCLSVCLGREKEALEKPLTLAFNILFEALEIDERYVIDFASWGLLFRHADNYEQISQSKQQSARLLLAG